MRRINFIISFASIKRWPIGKFTTKRTELMNWTLGRMGEIWINLAKADTNAHTVSNTSTALMRERLLWLLQSAKEKNRSTPPALPTVGAIVLVTAIVAEAAAIRRLKLRKATETDDIAAELSNREG